VKKRGGMPLLHMADGPEANKNLDDLDKMEMEEDLARLQNPFNCLQS
jgi:hypothetical protein